MSLRFLHHAREGPVFDRPPPVRVGFTTVARDLRARELHPRAPTPRSPIAACLAAPFLALTLTLTSPAAARASEPAQPPPAFDAAKPLYQFTEPEVGAYLAHLQSTEPDLRTRIVHLARKNLGQPYELYLLGEAPFETHDPQPLYHLGRSDCVVFTEHTLAMALSRDWPGFFRLLQRIRYRDGRIGVVTRNHFTEADWNPANRWLATDITAELAGDAAKRWDAKIDRSRFLLNRYKLRTEIPVEHLRDTYLPYEALARAEPHIAPGDIIQLVRGVVKPGAPASDIFGGSAWIGHLGLAARGDDGALHLIHSVEPMVREETIAALIARETALNAEKDAAGKPRLLGFKILHLNTDPLARLRELDGPDTPRISLPGTLP
jgi:hypothetical protein